MRMRMTAAAVVLCLAVPLVARAADKPALVVVVQSIDGLVADGRYLAELADKANEFKQYEGMLKSLNDPKKGIEGFDSKKPLGLYGSFNADDPKASELVLLAPVVDEKAVLDGLDKKDVKAEKGDDGIYTVAKVPNYPDSLYFVFANKYVYVSNQKAALGKGRLLVPGDVLATDATTVLSAVLHIDRIPEKAKNEALKGFTEGVNKTRDQGPPDEGPAQNAFRLALLDEITEQAKALINDGDEVRFSANIDRKAGVLSESLSFTAKPGSKLAEVLADLGARKSVGAGLVTSDAAASSVLNISIPKKVRSALAEAIDEGVKKALANEKDEAKRELLETAVKAIAPTLKAGELDYGSVTHAAGPKGTLSAVSGLKLADGLAVETAAKKILKGLPADVRDKIKDRLKIDDAKIGDVNVHRIDLKGLDLGPQFSKIYGSDQMFFAFRDDAVLFAVGEDGLSMLKDALAAKPKAGPMLAFEASVGAIVAMLPDDAAAGAAEAAKKAFKEKGGDRVRFSLDGGKGLTARFSVDAKVVTFAAAFIPQLGGTKPDKDR